MSNTPYKIVKNNTFLPDKLQGVIELHYRAEIDPNNHIFNGHFPDQPVVPGVCTLGMIKECVSDTLSKKIIFTEVKECKFLAAILPSMHSIVDVFITLKRDKVALPINVTALVKHNDTIMMKLKATAM